MSHLGDDLRFSLRYLRRRPGFAIAALGTLALAIGATTAVFSLVYGVLLRPLDLPHPDRLVLLFEDQSRRGGDAQDVAGIVTVHDWSERTRSFEGIAGSLNNEEARVALSTGGSAEAVITGKVSPGYFRVLGVPPSRGREFLPAEEIAGNDSVAVLSYGLWQRSFGGRDVLGKPVRIDGKPRTIVGVMPRELRDPLVPQADLWVPLSLPAGETDRGENHVRVLARLRDGVTVAQARADLRHAMGTLATQYAEYHDVGADVAPLQQSLVGDVERPGLALLAAVLLLLLIACVNLANLLLARAAERDREIAVRTAVGADRRRTVVQLVTESLVLAGGGGALGIALGAAMLRLLVRLAPPGMPRLYDVGLHPMVLGVAIATTVAVGLLFGLAPAWRASGVQPSASLRQGRGLLGGAGGALRRGLIVAEVAMSLALLVGAGLLARTLLALSDVDPGFAAHDLLAAQVALPEARYADTDAVVRGVERLEERLRALPGARAVGVTTKLPLMNYFTDVGLHVEGMAEDQGTGPVEYSAVTPSFFATFGVPLLAGRAFTTQDRADAPRTMVVNHAFAARFLRGRDALGARVRIGKDPGNPWWTVVGVVGDVHHAGLATAAEPQVYLSEYRVGLRSLQIVVRAPGDPSALAAGVRQAVREVDPELPVMVLRRGDDLLAGQLAMPRFLGVLLGAFAAVALVLALVGLYGVMSFLVAHRQREMGLRLALGALPREVLLLVLRESSRLTAAGVGIGVLLALALGRGLASELFGVRAADPWTLALAALLVGLAALAATAAPALRAAHVDPASALQE